MSTGISTKDIERFWTKVALTANPDKCWEWQACQASGRGRFQLWGHSFQAHRVAWEITNKQAILPGMCVLHRCDNIICVNPEHLFLGTQMDNIADMKYKGRQQCGEKHWNAKLSWPQVEEIRDLYSQGVSQVTLGHKFGVSQTQIERIVNNRRWKKEVSH